VRQEWSPEDLIGSWTLVEEDWRLVGNKTGPTRLGFALLLKFFELEARFPRYAEELPAAAVDYVAGQVQVDAAVFAKYAFSGRTVEYHRAQIRRAFGFREWTVADEERLAAWLAEEVCPVELVSERLAEALLVQCRTERIEPPGPSRVERLIGAARSACEARFCERTVARLGEERVKRLTALVETAEADGPGRGLLAKLKVDPGRISLETLLREIDKLTAVRALGLPADLFADALEKLVDAWRARAARSYPSDLRASAAPVRLTLLAALCWVRQAELTDALVELLIGLVHKINARAEKKVGRELTADLKRVPGKESILFRLAGAAVDHPDHTVRRVLFPVVGGQTLRGVGRRGQGEREGVPGQGADQPAALLLQSLPADAAAAVGHPVLPV
jgi:Domain of unknown function (DUF4158)